MATITIHDHDLLHPADTRDVWVNIVGDFRRLDGITAEELAVELTCLTRGVATLDDHRATITAVLDTVPAQEFRRLAETFLLTHGASAEVEWRYEIAPTSVERLGMRPARDRTRRGGLRRWVGRLQRRR